MCVRDRLACLPGGDRRSVCLAWRPRDPNLRNGQQLGSNISFLSLFFGVPKGSLAHRYTSSLWGLLKHWDGSFFHTASQPRGRTFTSIASWSGSHCKDRLLLFRPQILLSVWHDTASLFVYASHCRLTFITCTLDMASGPPPISSMGYAPNDPRRGNALYGRHEDAFARQYVVILDIFSKLFGLPMALLDKDLLSPPTGQISGLPQDRRPL